MIKNLNNYPLWRQSDDRIPQRILGAIGECDSQETQNGNSAYIKNGYITSEELKDVYGYNHPPRAVRDVREYGIPLVTYRVQGSDGRKIAAYKFGDPHEVQNALSKTAGRTVLSKALKQALIEKYGARCFIYLEEMDESKLQVDHRVPYEIGGEHDEKT